MLWTPASVGSDWVNREATFGRQSGKLVSVMLETADMPINFINTNYLNLMPWNEGHYDGEWQRLVNELQACIDGRGRDLAHRPGPEHLEISSVRVSDEGVMEVIVRNLTADPVVIDELAVEILADHGRWAGVLEVSTTYELDIDDLRIGESRALPIAFEVESRRAERFEIDLKTGRILDFRLTVSYNRGRTVAVNSSTMDEWLRCHRRLTGRGLSQQLGESDFAVVSWSVVGTILCAPR